MAGFWRSEAGEDSDEELATTQSSTRSTRSRRGVQNGTALEESENTPAVNGVNGHGPEEPAAMEVEDDLPNEISQDRLESFKSKLCRAFQENRTQALSLSRVKQFVNEENATPYTQGEINAAIEKMSDENQVMMADGIIFLI